MGYSVKFYDSSGYIRSYDDLFNVRLSSYRYVSIDYFKVESRRLSFKLFIDNFLENEILGGEDIGRGISKYYLRLYRDGEIEFTGIIDLHYVKYNLKDRIIEIYSYDNLRLFGVYGDIEINQTGVELRDYFLTPFGDGILDKIRAETGNLLPLNMEFDYEIDKWGEGLYKLFEVDFEEGMIRAGLKYELSEELGELDRYEGFFELGLDKYYLEYGKLEVYHNKVYFIFRLYRLFPNLCWSLYREEYDEVLLSEEEEYNNIESKYEELLNFYQIDLEHLAIALFLNEEEYYYYVDIGDWKRSIKFNGNIFNERFYISDKLNRYPDKVPMERVDAIIKAMLLSYNLILYVDKGGLIHLSNKNRVSGEEIAINREDLIELNYGRVIGSKLELESLDILSGNNEIFKAKLLEYYEGELEVLSRIEAKILGDYSIDLGDVLIIEGNRYRVVSKKLLGGNLLSIEGWEYD